MEQVRSIKAANRFDGMNLDYTALNAMLNLYDAEGKIQFDADKEAARQFFLQHVNQNTMFFHDTKEKLDYLVENDYYRKEVLDKYSFDFIESLFAQAYKKKFRFESFFGAFKYYKSYTLKTFDGKKYLERFEDRVCMVALALADGDEKLARNLMEEIISGRYQPATPTFSNAGKKQSGELVSCFLLRVEDSMKSINAASSALRDLSKAGGGVAILLTNLRELLAPIKMIEGQASGVVPVMKIFENDASYANQLGARDGAAAVYLNVHHPDIMRFLDTKRENADEAVRIKKLSLGVVIPDITFELAAKNEDMYLFSPYDVERVYGIPMSDISITEKYYEMVDDRRIKKSKINARKLFETIAELQFESGYPYMMFEDHVNRANPIEGRINMSNLCSEILQVNTPSDYYRNGHHKVIGVDISCNLGSQNIAKTMDGPNFGLSIETSIRALTAVSDQSNIEEVTSIRHGNEGAHAVGLGAMNLHGYLAREHIYYGSDEGLDFTNIYFYTVTYHAIRASNMIAKERGKTFRNFRNSKYASGEYFDKYTNRIWRPRTQKIKEIFEKARIHIPTQEDWLELKASVMKFGLYNQNLQAVPPTGSISYINNSTSSIHPIIDKVETRKEGKTGRSYYPAPYMTNENIGFYQSAFDIGPKAIIDTYAEATQHIDQGLSLTLFVTEKATTRDLTRAANYAYAKGIKTIYYWRVRQASLEGTEVEGCVSCSL